MRKLLVLPLLLVPGLLFGQGPAAVDSTFANKRDFRIPFNPGAGGQNLKQLQLYVSTDQGRTWMQSSTVAPSEGRFQFRAENDGTYWFAVQTLDLAGKVFPPTMDGVPPTLKVIVDTQPPAVQLTPLAPQLGQVGVAWSIRDDNFDALGFDAVRLEYRLGGAATWQRLAVPAGATQFYWNPGANAPVEVRLRARDRAGNVGEQATTLSLTGAVPGVPPAAGGFPNQPLASLTEADLVALGAADRRFVNTKKITLSCELKELGPSGVKHVELWWTHDPRVRWEKRKEPFPVTAGDESHQTFAFEVVGDGVYGITLLAHSGVGFAERPPQLGDRPQLWIEVDTTRPDVKLGAVVVGQGADKGKLTVTWSAFDKNLVPQGPITLAYAEKADGPWTPFAEKLANSGRHVWTMPTAGVPYQFFVKVEAIDKAGNVGEAVTPMLIKVDLATPKVKILNVEPSK